MSDKPEIKAVLLTEPVPIGVAAGWDLFYVSGAEWSEQFLARRGRKERKESSVGALLKAIEDAEAAEKRKAHRAEPCLFPQYLGNGKWQRAELTSYTNKGAYVRGDVATGILEDSKREDPTIQVLRGDPIEASKELAAAEEVLRLARAALVEVKIRRLHVVKMASRRFGSERPKDVFAEEDRIKDAIRKLSDVRRESL